MLEEYRRIILTQWARIDKQLKLKDDFFSLQRFQSIAQGLKVSGSYAIAAAVMVPLVNVLMIPLMSVCLVAGAVYGLKSFDENTDQAKKSIKTALTFLGAGLYLPIAGLSMHYLLASVFLWRAYKSLSHWAQGHTLEGFMSRVGAEFSAGYKALKFEVHSAFSHSKAAI